MVMGLHHLGPWTRWPIAAQVRSCSRSDAVQFNATRELVSRMQAQVNKGLTNQSTMGPDSSDAIGTPP